jgi:hypothetical protein
LRRGARPWASKGKPVLAAFLVTCVAVEVDLAIVREHAAVQARAEHAVDTVHKQVAQDLAA